MKMSRQTALAACAIAVIAALALAAVTLIAAPTADPPAVMTGNSAFANYSSEKPGLWRKITAADLPKPFATEAANNRAKVVPRPDKAWPQALPGFKVWAPGVGVIMNPPVSVCHQVSTMGHFSRPTLR